MALNIQDARILIKRSTNTGEIPTVAPSNDHTDGTWDALDIYTGELFLNVADSRAWFRSNTAIIELATLNGPTDAFVNGGNAFGSTAVFGLSDDNQVDFKANNITVFSYDKNGVTLKTAKPIYFQDSGGTNTVDISAPTSISASYSLNLPTAQGGTDTYLKNDGSGNLSWATVTGGGGGGGGGVSYYLNGGTSQGTFGGNTYYEINKVAVVGTGVDFTRNTNGYIANFITDANDPGLLSIPAGNWNCEIYMSASSAGGSPSFYLELYKYDGTNFTLIADNSANPEGITGGTAIDLYTTTLSVPQTTLTITDRLAIRIYVTPAGRTITLHTQDNHLCQIITTFTTGLAGLNGLTAQVQNFATGTSGTDFNISSVTDTHTFNLPVASATKTGKLSNTDYTNFKAASDDFDYTLAYSFRSTYNY